MLARGGDGLIVEVGANLTRELLNELLVELSKDGFALGVVLGKGFVGRD